MNKEIKEKIEKLEYVWEVDRQSKEFEIIGDINTTTGFITPKGIVIPIGDRDHALYMDQFEGVIGLDKRVYFREYGAIRIRPGRVFLFFSNIPYDSLNVETFKKPTQKQIQTISKISCRIFYEMWSEDDAEMCKDNRPVIARTYINKLRKFYKMK